MNKIITFRSRKIAWHFGRRDLQRIHVGVVIILNPWKTLLSAILLKIQDQEEHIFSRNIKQQQKIQLYQILGYM